MTPFRCLSIRSVEGPGGWGYKQAAIYETAVRRVDGQPTFRLVENVGKPKRGIKKLTAQMRDHAAALGIPFIEGVRAGMVYSPESSE